MQPAIRSPAMVTSSSRRTDAVTRQVPFPSEARVSSKIKNLAGNLGKGCPIDLQGVLDAVPKLPVFEADPGGYPIGPDGSGPLRTRSFAEAVPAGSRRDPSSRRNVPLDDGGRHE